jgi:hypothetical protein
MIPNERRVAADQADTILKRNGVHIRRSITGYPKLKIYRAIRDDPSVQKLVKDEQWSEAQGFLVGVKTFKPGIEMENYKWLEGVTFDFREGPDLQGVLFQVANLDPAVEKLMLAFGFGRASSPYSIDLIDLTRMLRQDKYFPRDIQPEEVLRELTAPDVFMKPHLQAARLISMGLHHEIARTVINKFSTSWQQYLIKASSDSFSLRDPMLTMADMSINTFERLVEINAVIDYRFRGLMYELGMAAFIDNYWRVGKMQKVSVVDVGGINGKLINRFIRYNPDNELRSETVNTPWKAGRPAGDHETIHGLERL